MSRRRRINASSRGVRGGRNGSSRLLRRSALRRYAAYELNAGAGPLWGRLYEIGTNRVIMANRDGVKLYDWNKLTDRRSGYGWYTTSPAADPRDVRQMVATAPAQSMTTYDCFPHGVRLHSFDGVRLHSWMGSAPLPVGSDSISRWARRVTNRRDF